MTTESTRALAERLKFRAHSFDVMSKDGLSSYGLNCIEESQRAMLEAAALLASHPQEDTRALAAALEQKRTSDELSDISVHSKESLLAALLEHDGPGNLWLPSSILKRSKELAALLASPAVSGEGEVVLHQIPASKGLDPITYIMRDFQPGRGELVVWCYGKAWTAYWGSMGDRTIRQFLLDCYDDYIATKLEPDNDYVLRIVRAVQAHMRAAPPATPSTPSESPAPAAPARDDDYVPTMRDGIGVRMDYNLKRRLEAATPATAPREGVSEEEVDVALVDWYGNHVINDIDFDFKQYRPEMRNLLERFLAARVAPAEKCGCAGELHMDCAAQEKAR
jgi:hypothetical protein